jgi:hypothetical protein
MDRPDAKADADPPSMGLGYCVDEGVDYTHILLQRYLNRAGATMNDESPLVRQWILLRNLASKK